MESRSFIREAAVLIEDIKTFEAAFLAPEDEQAQGTALQKRTNALFGGLQNPSLPSAYKLRDACAKVGLFVDPRVLHRIASFENIQG
jgi:hypothetical protein